MKITIFSFDLWGFNKKIANELRSLGHTVNYVNTAKFKYEYPHFGVRFLNFFTKNLLKINLKHKFQRTKILKALTNNQSQSDIIFMVNPGYFPQQFTEEARKYASKLIAYNYDSLIHVPLPQNFNELFDEIYSFDLEDVKKNSFLQHLSNFNYLKEKFNLKPKNKAFIIISQSETRECILNKIADHFDAINIKNYQFIVHNPKLKKLNKNIEIITNHIPLDEINLMMENAEILIDLVRPNQTGLSFRIFEAMALHKKIITNNKIIAEYDFYNPNNILILNDELNNITPDFLNKKYEPLPSKLYQKYTLENWVKTVFYN